MDRDALEIWYLIRSHAKAIETENADEIIWRAERIAELARQLHARQQKTAA